MDLLAITSYYNPFRGKLRKKNYDIFRNFLGIELMTVEWSREGNFELCEEDADYLIQISGGDILWQKERLLNIGLQRAKELGFSKLAFLDCDIVFSEPSWFENVDAALDNFSIVQCYSDAHYLPPLSNTEISREKLFSINPEYTFASFVKGFLQNNRSMLVQNDSYEKQAIPSICGNPGLAIAVRIDKIFNWKHYEANIVGGGDSLFMAAVSDCMEELFTYRSYTPAHKEHILKWQTERIPMNARISYVNSPILHLWHGRIEERGYNDRWRILSDCSYVPERDLKLNGSGALTFTNAENLLSQRVVEYLLSRRDY